MPKTDSQSTLTEQEAYAKLADLCATAEYSSGEALQRLRQWGQPTAVAHAIVQRLIDERFIDDSRFARAYVRSKVSIARWGRIKIRQALALKGIDRETITTALEEIDLDLYHSNLADALRAKARTMPQVLEREHRDKLLRFAASRGYEPALIMEMLPEEDFWRHDPLD